MISIQQLAFRAVRRLILRPIDDWRLRQEIVEQLSLVKRLGRGVVVDGPISLGNPAETEIGDDVCLNRHLVVRGSGPLVLGSHLHFGHNVEILTSNHNFERPEALPYDQVRTAKGVVVGDCVWLGDRSMIVPGVTVGEGAILGAGAVITKDVPPLAIMGGAPAKIIRYRDEAAYRALVKEGRYLGWPRDQDFIQGVSMRVPRRS
ncbi:MAG: acyltransferase [Myxococcaceae bacterium]|nr:acyltransferase [Myxococcaceae bacterium]